MAIADELQHAKEEAKRLEALGRQERAALQKQEDEYKKRMEQMKKESSKVAEKKSKLPV